MRGKARYGRRPKVGERERVKDEGNGEKCERWRRAEVKERGEKGKEGERKTNGIWDR